MNLCLRNTLIIILCLFSSFTMADCNAQLRAITYSSGGDQYQVFGQHVNGLTQQYSLIIEGAISVHALCFWLLNLLYFHGL